MKKTICLLFCAVAMSIGAYAQLSIGPTAGGHITKYRFKGLTAGSATTSKSKLIDFRIGALANVPLTGKWNIQPGLLYTSNGHSNGTTSKKRDYDGAFNVNALEIPVFITYKTQQKNGGHFLFSAGPYIAINVNATIHLVYVDAAGNYFAEDDVTLKIGGSASSRAAMRRMAGGLGGNAGYETKGGFSVRLHFQKGMINMYPQPDYGMRMVSFNGGITFAYLFHLNKDKNMAKEKTANP